MIHAWHFHCLSKQLVTSNKSCQSQMRLLININKNTKKVEQKKKLFSVTHIQTPYPKWKQQPSEEHQWQESKKYSVTNTCRINHCAFSRTISIEVNIVLAKKTLCYKKKLQNKRYILSQGRIMLLGLDTHRTSCQAKHCINCETVETNFFSFGIHSTINLCKKWN